ncbi:unnamed protein product [Brassicogethes aeneus]|uniref:C2H2-type domain-containing protein n=1 Tax=Brassicogethes aeneus TaxID=1431903 RepID=A0A9P0B8K4_BRAAE|nr:unnamed protein product [Brassicogethes aeneus]
MNKKDCGIKRKSTIAVFEHVVEKEKPKKSKKFRTNRFLEDDSPSESELVIDDRPARKKNTAAIKLSEEPLALICEWDDCKKVIKNQREFEDHLMQHCQKVLDSPYDDTVDCLWKDCSSPGLPPQTLRRHTSYHGYLTKLANIGSNVLKRTNLPNCADINVATEFPIPSQGYTCEWEDCPFKHFETVFQFYDHMNLHVKNNPRVAKKAEVIQCFWKGCNNKYPNQYKLAEHLRAHTKEKTVACPACLTIFSSKTKFRDHRKRQLSTDLQSYQCAQCLKLFASERLLRDHMRSHINHYKCTMCDMTCPKPSNLAKHIRTKHIQFKAFKCDKCDKSFISRCNLRTHILVHTKYRFPCSECDFRCKSLYGLSRHLAQKHNLKSMVYECHNCKERFNRGGHLTKHLMKKHNYHWPSGHSRFKYRQDQDGIFRLQTVRYESLEVTEEMIRSETMQGSAVPPTLNYNIQYAENNETYVMSTAIQDIPKVQSMDTNSTNHSVLITIEDVDEDGNVLNSEVVHSNELVLANQESKITIVEHPLDNNQDGLKELGEFIVIKNNAKDSRKKKGKVSRPRKAKCNKKATETKDEKSDKSEDIHYFSKDIIENYDKFKIVTSSS